MAKMLCILRLLATLTAIIVILPLPTVLAQNNTFYVAKSGLDSNPGSQTQPWRTLGRAAAIMQPGDTVIVGEGTYDEIVRPGASGTASNRITYRAQSIATIVTSFAINKAYITVEGFTITAEGTGIDGGVFLNTGANYVRIINNVFPSSSVGISQLLTYGYAQNIVGILAEGNKFLNGWHHAVAIAHSNTPRDPAFIPAADWNILRNNYFSSPNGYDALRVNSSNLKIIGNTFEHWENVPISSGDLKPGVGYYFVATGATTNFSNVGAGAPPYSLGEAYAFTATGSRPLNWGGAVVDKTNHPDIIQSFQDGSTGADWPYKAHYVLFEGNRVYRSSGVQFGNITDDYNYQGIKHWIFRNNLLVDVTNPLNLYAPGFRFYNNTFYRVGANIGWVIGWGNSARAGIAQDVTVYNNIFAECGNPENPQNGWYGGDIAPNQVGDYNLVVGRGAGTKKNAAAWGKFGEQNGINGEDPLFVNAAAGDFRLQANSPAIGKAKILNSGLPDFEAFTYDINGVSRTNGASDTTWDIGAFESCSGESCMQNANAPNPPTNLSVK